MRRSGLITSVLLVTTACVVGLDVSRAAFAQGGAVEDGLPVELRAWQAWALDGSEFLRCPYVSGLDPTLPASRICHWVGALRVEAGATGASFHEQVRVFAPGWVALPGTAEYWPQGVRADGAPVAVVDRDGRPSLWLETEGAYSITGNVPWPRMPDALPVPPTAGIVSLAVAGQPVHDLEFSRGILRLGTRAPRIAQANNLALRIHRKLTDTLPGQLDTRLTLDVAGEPREEYVGPLLPAGFAPTRLQTPLPARLEADGRLRVQVRPGRWSLELGARAQGALDSIDVRAVPGAAGEVWSFAAMDRLRVASLEGAPPIDPAQADVPGEWQALPAYRVGTGTSLRVVERSRGFVGQDLNRLTVQRDLWRDFEDPGFTFRDHVSGEMQQGWRLDMKAPFELQGARSGDEPLLVTRGTDAGSAGVEWRSPGVDLEAIGRVATRGGLLAASGWDARLAGLGMTLHLPPGHRLLAALGSDRSPSAWLNRWQLLDIFIVLLVVAAAFRVAGPAVAMIALAALALAHHEQHAVTWLFLNLFIAIAIARAIPPGRFRSWARAWRNLAFAAVLVALVPFVLYQARLAFFPQLEPASYFAAGGAFTTPADAPIAAPAEVMSHEMAQDAGVRELAVRQRVDSARKVAASPSPAPPPPRAVAAYAPGTVLQSGPGVPQWSYASHRIEWSGPIEPTQSLRLLVLGPAAVSVWRLAACVLLAVLFVLLLRESYAGMRWGALDRWLPRSSLLPPAAMLLLGLVAAGLPAPVRAQTPSPEILAELKERLTRPPACAPACVSMPGATLRMGEDEVLEIALEAHAQSRAVLTLPYAARHWTLDTVRVDGAEAAGLGRDDSGRPILALESGVHAVVLRGRVAATDSLRVVFAQRPARVRIEAARWQASGVDDSRLLADSVTLTRRAGGKSTANGLPASGRATDEFPPFVHVRRVLTLGLGRWTARTTVERVAPEQGAFTLDLPLLPGESVQTANLPVRDGSVTVSMPADVGQVQWQSSLAIADKLELRTAPGSAWSESWHVDPGSMWRTTFSGTPEVFADPAAPEQTLHRFAPRPGESLDIEVARPAPVPGASIAIERVRQQVTAGQRAQDTVLQIAYRSTQGGRQDVQIPQHARLTSVTVDGQPLALHAEKGKLALPVQPGEHELALEWQADRAPAIVTRPEPVVLGTPVSNVTTTIALPDTRWILLAGGGGVGPAVLYWAELVVFIVLAVALGRLSASPLATREWLLVGLGLSTFSWSVLLIFAAWAFAMRWRRGWAGDVAPWVFNAVQVALAVLTIVALGSLVAAIPNGLLGTPDMRIDGAGSGGTMLSWFHDRLEDELPRPAVVSVSIWYYKAAMLAWALWLSFALVRWVRSAWDAFAAGRLWYSYRPARAAAAPETPGDGA